MLNATNIKYIRKRSKNIHPRATLVTEYKGRKNKLDFDIQVHSALHIFKDEKVKKKMRNLTLSLNHPLPPAEQTFFNLTGKSCELLCTKSIHGIPEFFVEEQKGSSLKFCDGMFIITVSIQGYVKHIESISV